jgi:hypothetical protein
MSLANLQNEMAGTEVVEDRDSVGGGVLEGGIYDMRIEVAYSLKSAGGALGFFTVWVNDKGRKITDRQYITSGTAKGGKPYYLKDGKKLPLPGFSHVDFMVNLLLDKGLLSLEEQQAVIKLYDGAQGKEVPTEVVTYPELRGVAAKVAIQQVRQNKQVKVGQAYVKSNEEQSVNNIDKYFDADTGKTGVELKANSDASFIETWSTKYAGQVVDTYKTVANAPQTGANPFADQAKSAGGEGHKPSTSMFGDTPSGHENH